MKKVISLLLVIFLIAFAFACKTTTETQQTGKNESTGKTETDTKKAELIPLNMAASDIGGEYYTIGALFNTLWEEHIPGVMTAIQPGGSTSNIKAVSKGDSELGWTHSAVVELARKGEEPFDQVYGGCSMIVASHPACLQFVVIRGSSIKSLSELANKKIGLNTAGSLGNVIAMQLLESEYGITEDSIKAAGGTISYLSKSEAGDALRDGQIDIWLFMGPYPETVLADLIFNPGLEFIDVEPEKLEHFLNNHPAYSTLTIPAGSYDGVNRDLPVICSFNVLVVRDDMDEELVYQMTKTIWENIDFVYAGSTTATRFMSIKEPCGGWQAAGIHPGALRYYKEVGVKFE